MTATERSPGCRGSLMAGSQEKVCKGPPAEALPHFTGRLPAGVVLPERFAGCLASPI